MERKGFIFYKSFYDSIKELDTKDQVQIYNAIFKYQFEGKETNLKGIAKSIFTLIIPQLEANNKKYINGCKGGRPKDNQEITKQEPKNNLNITKLKPKEKDKEKEKDKVKEKDNNIYDFVEENFGRILSPLEYELISTWEDNELTRYAIKQTVLNRATSLKYTQAILNSYKAKGIKNVLEAEKEDKKRNNKKEIVPEWFDKDIKQEQMTKEEQEELDNLLKDFN